MSEPSDTFCPLPFMHVATKTDGDIHLCCRSKPIGNIEGKSIREFWHGPEYEEVRRQMLSGERPPACQTCWYHEDNNIVSMRQRSLRKHAEFSKKDFETEPYRIESFEVKLSNFCNLACRMCNPLDSTSWYRDYPAIRHLMQMHNREMDVRIDEAGLLEKPYVSAWADNKQFWEDFRKIAPNLTYVEFAGGEPLIDPMHYLILDELEPYSENIDLKYSTNLTKLEFQGEHISTRWKKFNTIDLSVSMDGVFQLYNYIRQGPFGFEDIRKNISRVKDIPNVNRIRAACTFQAYNAHHLPKFIDTCVKDMEIVPIFHRVMHPEFLDARILPQKYKDEIAAELEAYKKDFRGPDELRFHVWMSIDDNINHMMSANKTYLFPKFVEYSDILDQRQRPKMTWRELIPNLGAYA